MGNKKKSKKTTTKTASGSTARPPTPSSPPPPADEVQEERSESPPPLETAEREPEPEPEPVDPIARAERLKELGNELFKQKKYTDALDRYTQAIDLNPKEPTYLTNRAAAAMALKRFKVALADCQAAAALQSDAPSAKTLVRLGRCHLALGNPSLAISTTNAALQIEPGNAQAKQQVSAAQNMAQYLKNVEEAMAKRDWSFARLALDKAEQACEGDIPVAWRLWRTRIDLGRKQFDAANESASNALRLDQNAPDPLALRGLVLFLTGKLPQAIQHAQSALRSDPEHKAARELLRRAREVERIKEEGNNAFKIGRTDEAIAKYSESLDLIGEKEEEGGGGTLRATLLSNRATAYMKANQPDDAIADADACVAISPLQWKALRTRARARLSKDEFDEAVNDFRTALEAAQSDTSDASIHRSIAEELRKAEVLLKRSKAKDYYKILGLERTCSDADIKKAYRRESLKHHPDKGGDEEKFKLVVEANTVLSDPQRRQRYDDGEDEDGGSNSGGPGMGGMDMNDLASLFAQMQGGGFSGFGGGGGRGFGGGGAHFSHGGGGGFNHGGFSHGF